MIEHPAAPPRPVDPEVGSRADLDARLHAARLACAGLEHDVRDLRAQHDAMRHSAARRLLARTARLTGFPFRLLLRPIDTTAWLAAKAAGWGPLARLRAAVERFAIRSSPLQPLLFAIERGDDESVRWLGPVSLRGITRDALLCRAPAVVSWTVAPVAGARLVVDCALPPDAWVVPAARIECLVEVEVTGREPVRRRLTLHPARRWSDRRWRRVAIACDTSTSMTVRLITRAASGASSAWASAAWGSPRLELRRPPEELLRSLRAALRALGPRGFLRRALAYHPGAGSAAQTAYLRWCARHTPDGAALAALGARVAQLPRQPLVSIITPVFDTDPDCLRACYASVRAQVYDKWEWCVADDGSTREETRAVLEEIARDPRVRLTRLPQNGHICVASNAALATASGEYIALLDHDDELTPDALAEMVLAIDSHPEADFLYSDEDKLDLAGQRCDPFFKPDWSPEFFRTCMYTCHLMVLRRSLVEATGGFTPGMEGAQDYDLALRVIERTSAIHHVPRVLYHWRRLPESTASSGQAKPWALAAARRALEAHVTRAGLDADVLDGAVPGLFRVRWRLQARPLVTIVMPTDGRTREVNGRRVDLVANAVRSIAGRTTYPNYEVLVVDNGRLTAEAEAALASVRHRRVTYRFEGRFNFAHKLNFCVRHASGEQLVIFNDDLEVITPDWLEALLEYGQQPEIGVVGAKLHYPDGRLQHAGMVLGVCGVAAHAWHALPGDTPGYASSAISVRNYSAVTGACMLTRREVFEAVGGFNEQLAIDFNDVDYCLRVRERGLRIVFTPYATLYHHESGTLGARTQSPRELGFMLERWGTILARDPYYNENLTREFPDFRLGS